MGREEGGSAGQGRKRKGERGQGKGEKRGKGRAREGRKGEYNVSRILAAACWQPYLTSAFCINIFLMPVVGCRGEEASGMGVSSILTLYLGDRSHCVWGIGVNDAAFCRCLLVI